MSDRELIERARKFYPELSGMAREVAKFIPQYAAEIEAEINKPGIAITDELADRIEALEAELAEATRLLSEEVQQYEDLREQFAVAQAQEPVAWAVRSIDKGDVSWDFIAGYPEACHEHINDYYQIALDEGVQPDKSSVIPLFTAPQPVAQAQEPTTCHRKRNEACTCEKKATLCDGFGREPVAQSQEPVAHTDWNLPSGVSWSIDAVGIPHGMPLYTAPPPSAEDVAEICEDTSTKSGKSIRFVNSDYQKLPVGTLLFTTPPPSAEDAKDAAIVAMVEDGWLHHGPEGMNEAQEKLYSVYRKITEARGEG
jgi:hypothetical protein